MQHVRDALLANPLLAIARGPDDAAATLEDLMRLRGNGAWLPSKPALQATPATAIAGVS
jgi:hypothetical protein